MLILISRRAGNQRHVMFVVGFAHAGSDPIRSSNISRALYWEVFSGMTGSTGLAVLVGMDVCWCTKGIRQGCAESECAD